MAFFFYLLIFLSFSLAANNVQRRSTLECRREKNTSSQGGWSPRQQTPWAWWHPWGAGRWDSRPSTWRNVSETRIWHWKGHRATPVINGWWEETNPSSCRFVNFSLGYLGMWSYPVIDCYVWYNFGSFCLCLVLWFFFLVLVPDSSFVEQYFRKRWILERITKSLLARCRHMDWIYIYIFFWYQWFFPNGSVALFFFFSPLTDMRCALVSGTTLFTCMCSGAYRKI